MLAAQKTSSVPPVEITVDREISTPVEEDGVWWLTASIPSNVQGERTLNLGYRQSSFIDFGFSVKVPEGFELTFNLSDDLRSRGLEVYKNRVSGDNKASLGVRNLGKELVIIRDKDRIAFATIRPIYPLTFIKVENGL